MAEKVNLKEWSDKQLESGLVMMINAADRLYAPAGSIARQDIKRIKREMDSRGLSYHSEPEPMNWRDFI